MCFGMRWIDWRAVGEAYRAGCRYPSLIDHSLCVAARRFPFAIGHYHRRAWKRDQVHGQGAEDAGSEGSDAIVLRHACDADGQQQTKRRIDPRVEPGEPTSTHALEETDVLEVANGTCQQTERERERGPGEEA